ncbi:MAG: hypothetical protein AAF826_09245 [Pseudomonadota bacterium]
MKCSWPSLTAAMLALAACTPSGPSGPNGGLVDGPTAGQLFASVCGDTAPTFSGYFTAVTNGSYQRDPATNLYEHVKLDLNFQLTQGRTEEVCRMQFRSNEERVRLALFVTSAIPGAGRLELNQETGVARRELAPNVVMTFQPALPDDNLHTARINVGVR